MILVKKGLKIHITIYLFFEKFGVFGSSTKIRKSGMNHVGQTEHTPNSGTGTYGVFQHLVCVLICIILLSSCPKQLSHCLCSVQLYFNSILTMVCNTALLVRNQTSAIMSVYSLNHYHAEWPLMTEP